MTKGVSPMESRHRPRLLIADDHVLIAEACKNLLEPEFQVVGVVSDGHALLKAAPELKPDVVIVDIAMPQLNGLDAGEQIKQKNHAIKLIYLTMNVRPDVAAEAFRRGASGYVLKHCTAEELIVAVRRVLRGESYLSPLITKDTVEFLLRTGAAYSEEKRISGRQSEVLQLLAEGKSMKEIAYILQLKPGTVAFHKYRIMEVLGLRSNAELIEYAIKHHMVAE
jgi:DNA-binding NarL/FixJ family response regulator